MKLSLWRFKLLISCKVLRARYVQGLKRKPICFLEGPDCLAEGTFKGVYKGPGSDCLGCPRRSCGHDTCCLCTAVFCPILSKANTPSLVGATGGDVMTKLILELPSAIDLALMDISGIG